MVRLCDSVCVCMVQDPPMPGQGNVQNPESRSIILASEGFPDYDDPQYIAGI